MSNERVLVVGTTPDYIGLIERRFPQRALFLTDRGVRAASGEAAPAGGEEIVTDLRDVGQARLRLTEHLAARGLRLVGVTSYDCESLAVAARLAVDLDQVYPSPAAIAVCRDKFACKRLWRAAGLPCPQAALVQDAEAAVAFRRAIGGPVVLKPLTGTGSELVFLCASETEIRRGVATILNRLARLPDARLFGRQDRGQMAVGTPDPRRVVVVEEFIRGEEFSADAILEAGQVRIVRLARKHFHGAAPLGTTLAYELPSELPPPLTRDALAEQFLRAAQSLGLQRTMLMIDFIVRGGRALMIELAPRPGGDCLPPLIRCSCGLDMLGAALDFAAGEAVAVPPLRNWRMLVGVRLLARQAGRLIRLDTRRLAADPRVQEHLVTRGAGHRIVLPPADYDSRILGYAIFAPSGKCPLGAESLEVADLLGAEVAGDGGSSGVMAAAPAGVDVAAGGPPREVYMPPVHAHAER